MQYRTHYSYIKKTPTIILWWPMPIFLVTEIIVLYPFLVPSDLASKGLSLIFVAGFLYLIFLNVERNYYLKRTVLGLSIEVHEASMETLMGTVSIPLPCKLGVAENVRKRHEATYPRGSKLYRILDEHGDDLYLSSRMENFEDILSKIVSSYGDNDSGDHSATT